MSVPLPRLGFALAFAVWGAVVTEGCGASYVPAGEGGEFCFENDRITLRFNAAHGTLVGITDRATGTEWLGGDTHANFSAWIDRTTSDRFHASGELVRGRDLPLMRFAVNETAGGTRLDLFFENVGGPGVRLTQHVALFLGDPVSHWTTEVTVDPGVTATVRSFVSPQVTGVVERPGERLAWPWKEGVIYTQPGAALQRMGYPLPASMQWMQLYDDRSGLYVAALDDTAAFKELRFGYDGELDAVRGSAATPRQMSVALYPFVASGQTYTSPTIDVGIAPEGGWYWGADRYRAWLAQAGWVRTSAPIATDLAAWRNGANVTKRGQLFTYCEIPKLLLSPEYVAKTGVRMLELRRWHQGGLDAFYPDYDFLSADAPCQRESDLRDAMAALHRADQQIVFYLNGRIADPQSRWYQQGAQGDASAVKALDGSMRDESYSGRGFRVMCPSAGAWVEQLASKVDALRGANGIWWDQVEETGASLCFDRTHGHASPATAFAEGYAGLFRAARARMIDHGGDTLFAAEGVSDVHARFIDVHGMMWSRKLGYRCAAGCGGTAAPSACVGEWPCGDPEQAPELTRYTLSSKFLGIQNADASVGASDEYARAFLLGEPLMAPDYPRAANTHAFPRYVKLYESAPDIFFRGRYLHERGLTMVGAGVRGAVLLGDTRAALAVQVFGAEDAPFTAMLSLHAMGLDDRRVAAVTDGESGAPIAWRDTGDGAAFEDRVSRRDVRSYRVALSPR